MLKYCIIPKKSIYRSRVKLYTSLIFNQKSIHCQMIDMHGLSFSSDRPYFTNSVAKLTKLINKVSFVLSSQDLFLTSYHILQTLAGLFLILVASISFLSLFLHCFFFVILFKISFSLLECHETRTCSPLLLTIYTQCSSDYCFQNLWKFCISLVAFVYKGLIYLRIGDDYIKSELILFIWEIGN